MQEKIKKYLEWKGTYAPRACVNYKIWLVRFIQVCGIKPLAQYELADYIRYSKWIESHYSSYCIQYSTVVIKNFFKFYRDQDEKCMSPSLIKIPRFRANSHRAITEEEYNKIIAEIPNNNFLSLRNLLIIRLLWDTGVRVSELCELNVPQVNEINHSCVIYTKKNNNARIIVWSEETHRLLQKYLAIRMEMHKLSNVSALFVGPRYADGWNNRLTRRSVERMILKYAKRAGIKEKVTPHSFRHGWAHKRRDQNAPLAFIQRGLGHVNPISTFIYEQYNDKEFVKHATAYLQPA